MPPSLYLGKCQTLLDRLEPLSHLVICYSADYGSKEGDIENSETFELLSPKILGDGWFSLVVKSKPFEIEISAKLKSPRDFNAQSYVFALHTHISEFVTVMENFSVKSTKLSQCNFQ